MVQIILRGLKGKPWIQEERGLEVGRAGSPTIGEARLAQALPLTLRMVLSRGPCPAWACPRHLAPLATTCLHLPTFLYQHALCQAVCRG